MSSHSIRQRNAIRSARSRNHPRVTEREWLGPTSTMFRVVRPAPPNRWQRFVNAAWRVHDTGMPRVWVAIGCVVMSASLFALWGIAAVYFRGTP